MLVSDVTGAGTSVHIMILMSQLLDWNTLNSAQTWTKKYSRLCTEQHLSSLRLPSASVSIVMIIIYVINLDPEPGAKCCYNKFTGCNCDDPGVIYLHIFSAHR